jgi:hypothetical protein
VSRRVGTIPGIGVLGVTAIVATAADPTVFRSGRGLDRAGFDRGQAEAQRERSAAHPSTRCRRARLANLAHVLGAALLVGAIATFDVQLLRGAPHPRTTYRAAMPVAAIGLALQVLSGIVLLAADAMPVMGNAAFQFKMAMFALGLVNVAAFYWRYGGALKADAPLDRGVGFAAVSLASWVLVLLAGRATAYI